MTDTSPPILAPTGNGQSDAVCANCGAILHGPFCSRCGQAARERIVPLGRLLSEGVGDFLNFDRRVFRTLGRIARPGALTEAYLAGQQVPFVPPFRLALTASLALFVALALRAPRATAVTLESSLVEDIGLLAGQRSASLAATLLLLLPVLAALLMIAFRRAGRLYVEHLVFALHLHAFASLVAAAAVLVSFAVEGTEALGWLVIGVLLVTGAYLVVAMRRVYGGSWLRTALAWVFVAGGYALLVTVAFLAVAVTVVARIG